MDTKPSHAKVPSTRYHGRIAQISKDGEALGYMQAFSDPHQVARSRRKRETIEDRLMWVIEWNAPNRWTNGYSDEAGDAMAEDVAEVLSDWDRGVHEGAGEWFHLIWLSRDDALDVAERFGWDY